MRRRQSVGNRMLAIALDPGSTAPLYVQIYESIRRSIVEGRLTPGSFLPSSRTLADDLAIARSTVVGAYEQLHAEGYLEGTVGAGTRVTAILPDALVRADAPGGAPSTPGTSSPRRRSQDGPFRLTAGTPRPRHQSCPDRGCAIGARQAPHAAMRCAARRSR